MYRDRGDSSPVIDGSARLIHSFTRLGLIDEYRIRVHPVVRGVSQREWAKSWKSGIRSIGEVTVGIQAPTIP
ncbi:dihydrofolate reductase family protein [Ktedonobacter racemifer]|uniref:dihydrofolate reductase family protein n=1 Tax=Ktedonobacter racemifer TaxID=363277 RepID=UPI003B75B9FE